VSVLPVAAPAQAPARATAVAAPPAPAAATGGEVDPRVREAARQFEGVFMSMLVGEMFKGTELESSQPIYGGLMTQAFGDSLADSGGIGLAAMLTRRTGGAS
jgi:peptidoglycan hydrolase FlgJ